MENKNNKIENLIEKASVSKTIMILVIPALLGSVVGQINFLLDTFFLNKATYIDTQILEVAISAAFPISLLVLALSTLFAIGGSLYATRTLGEGNSYKARSVFSGTVIYGLLVNFIFIIVLMIFLNPLLKILGANTPEVLKYANDYASVMIIGSFSVFLSFIFTMFARSEGKVGLVLFAILFQTITNIVLNYLFVIGFEWATMGASLATVISQVTQIIIIGVFLFSSKSVFRFTFKIKEHFNFEDFKDIMYLGFPATIGIVLLTVSSAILQIQASAYNDPALQSSIGVAIKMFTIFTMLIQAAASGIQPVFSYSYGSKNKERFIDVSKGYLKASVIGSIIIGILLFIFPYTFSTLLGFSGQEAEYIKTITYGLAMMLFIMPASFLYQVLFQSLGDAKTSLIIVLIRQILVFLVLSFILNYLFGIIGLLLAQQISITIGSIITILMYKNKLKKSINKSF